MVGTILKIQLLAIALGLSAASLSIAACTAELETGCVGGECDPAGAGGGDAAATTTTGVGGGGGGGEGGQGPECLACLDGLEPQTGVLPCEIEQILVDKCQRCHMSPPEMGAPFPLMEYADTQADYLGGPIFQKMHGAIKIDFMPLTPPKLTATEKTTITEWLCACAPPAPEGTTCP